MGGNGQSKHVGCKAPGCTEKHSRHHCNFCGDDDADHRANMCPKRHKVTLLHGTSLHFAQLIQKNGWKESTKGWLGPAVYFTQNRQVAENAAKRHGQKGAVIKCEVDLGNCKCSYGLDKIDFGGKWRQHYDSVYRRHPPWPGVALSKFREFAVKKEKIVKILEVKEV